MGVLIVLLATIAICFVFAWIFKKLGFMKEDREILKEHRNKKIK